MFNPIACGICISKINTRVDGHALRPMIKKAAWAAAKNGGGAFYFKKHLEDNMRSAVPACPNPDEVADGIWDQIKHKCRGDTW
jgi:hypothetical protein